MWFMSIVLYKTDIPSSGWNSSLWKLVAEMWTCAVGVIANDAWKQSKASRFGKSSQKAYRVFNSWKPELAEISSPFLNTRSGNQDCRVGVARNRSFFGWSPSRILNNTRSRSRFFCPTPTTEVQMDYFLYHTPKLGIAVEMVQFLSKLLLKQVILAVYHDFHWLLIAAKFLTAILHGLYFGEVGVIVRHFTSDSVTLK